MKYRINTQKTHKRKLFLQNSIACLLLSDTFTRNTDCDLIQNNNNLRYHKELKKTSTTALDPQHSLDPQHLKVKDIE